MTSSAATSLPAVLARLGTYLGEMYPLPRRAAGAALLYTGLASLLGRLQGGAPWRHWGDLLLGCWSAFAFMLVLRLMDELKDVVTDAALFPTRPLPSGRVLESDVAALLKVVATAFLLSHARAGWALLTAAGILAYAWLMFRWFFVPGRMRPDLPLTLATHNPVVPLFVLHLVTLQRETGGPVAATLPWPSLLALVASYWAAFLAWEIARKIRTPAQEDACLTYSRLLGPVGAVGAVLATQTAGLLAALWLFRQYGLSPAFLVPLVGGYLVSLAGSIRFLVAPGPDTSRLRPFAEAHLLGLFLAGLWA